MRHQEKIQRDADVHSVRVLADRFQPPYVRVKLGDKVSWSLEMDGRPSNVKAMHVVSFVQLDEESDLMKTKED
jgi:plastocyanin